MKTREQRTAEKIEKMKARMAKQKLWNEQHELAWTMPPLDLLEKAKSGSQLNQHEAQRIYTLHGKLASELEHANEELKRRQSKLVELEKEMRDQQFFSAKLHSIATTHDDKLGAEVSSVLWGRAANLLKSLIS